MNPRLLAISGSLTGVVFSLNENEITIGRDNTNAICLNDPSVSRQHCFVKREKDDRFFVSDRESFNGVFVNGTPVNKHEITHGDQIGIGNVIMFFLLHDTPGETAFQEAPPAIVFDNEPNVLSTLKLERKNAVYLSKGDLAAQLPKMARVSRDLAVLLEITSALNSAFDLDGLQRMLLELIMKAIPAERGAVLLVDEHAKEITSHFIWPCHSGDNIKISRTIIQQCLKENVSILCNNVNNDEQFHLSESLASSNVRSILCVPLAIQKHNIGLLYMEASSPNVVFDQDHLQLLTGIGEIAVRPLENVGQVENLKLENQRLAMQIHHGQEIIGESDRLKNIFHLIAKVAPTDSTVLILGNSGTGKELAARSIHQHSQRKNKPFVTVNCATLTHSLLESELFGHERGAFTGAISEKKGQFEVANSGTIFLDEIGELGIDLQAKLLRVLQEKEIIRIGSIKPKKVDIRVIAATNRNLEEAIKAGTFREDLYFRLNVISMKMPSLRERFEDIGLLTRFFINKFNLKCNRQISGVSSDARLCIQNYEWPGNIRELKNVIERAVILAQDDIITLDDLPETLLNSAHGSLGSEDLRERPLTFRKAIFEAKKNIVRNAITESDGNIPEAARILNIHPNNLYRLIKDFGLRDT